MPYQVLLRDFNCGRLFEVSLWLFFINLSGHKREIAFQWTKEGRNSLTVDSKLMDRKQWKY
jgi:hypothetical protein